MADQLFLNSIDLSNNSLKNVVIHQLASDPGSPVQGNFRYNTTSDVLKYQDDVGAKTIASTAWVLLVRLDQLAAPTSDVNLNSQKITNLATPTSGSDAANKAYVDSVANGTDWKSSVRAATTTNITLSGTQTIDGISVVADERVLVKDQTDAEDNGLYLCKSGAWVRTTDADADAEVTSGLAVFVTEGTVNGDTQWVLTTNDPIVVGTTELVFTQLGAGSSYSAGVGIDITGGEISIDTTVTARHTSATITGNDSTTDFAITHNLNTRDVNVQVHQAGSPYATVFVACERNSVNQVTIKFDVAPPTSTNYRVTIIG